MAACVLSAGTQASAQVLVNPGFELGADGPGAPGWGGFNDHFTSSDFALSGAKSLKVFGPFFHGGGAGVVQGGFPALPGQTWQASSSIFSPTNDFVGVNNFAITKLEFLNASNSVIGAFESSHFNNSSPANTWVEKTVTGVAPAGTTSAQIVLVHVQLDPVDGGAVFYDDASLTFIPEPATMALAGSALIGVVAMGRRRR
jgi:hypothetical protein